MCRQYKALFLKSVKINWVKKYPKLYDVIDVIDVINVISLSLKIDRTVQVAGAAQRQDIPYLFQYTTGRNIKDNHIWFVPSIGLNVSKLILVSNHRAKGISWQQNKSTNLFNQVLKRLCYVIYGHPLDVSRFSIFLRSPRSRFTRCQRVSTAFALLFLSMLANAMWYFHF